MDQFNQNEYLGQISVVHLGEVTLTLCVPINQKEKSNEHIKYIEVSYSS